METTIERWLFGRIHVNYTIHVDLSRVKLGDELGDDVDVVNGTEH